MKRLSSFIVDYSQESQLLLPFSTLPQDAEVYEDDKGSIYIRTCSYLFIVSERTDFSLEPFLSDYRIRHFLYPVAEEEDGIRYLMRKKSGKCKPSTLPLREIARFYEHSDFPDSDYEYLLERKKEGEAFFTECDERGNIITAAYTTKHRHTLVNLTTREDMRGKGHASALLKNTPPLYLFCETPQLRDFYSRRGFETVRMYKSISRRIDL